MTKHRGWLVPDDWDGQSYQFITLCAPCSVQWTGVVFGAIYELTRARNWDADSGDFLGARDIAKEVFYSMANCNDGFQAIADAIALLARTQATGGFDCGCPGGTGTEYDGPNEQQPTVFGPGEQWPTEQDYLDDKCHIANLMVQDYRQMWVDLDNLDIDTLTAGVASLGIGIVASVIAATFATGPIGLTIGVVAGLVSLFVGIPLFDLSDIIATIDANKNDLVCALYSASDASEAKTDFEAILATGPLSFLETSAINLVGVNNFYNQLFTPQEGYESQTVSAPVDCATCPGPLGVYYQIDGDGNESGNGAIFTDGTPMTITSQLDTTLGFHYIRVGIYEEGVNQTANYANDCTALPPGVLGTNNASFEFVMTGLVRNPNSGTLGTECDGGNFGVAFNSSIVQGQTYITTWFEYISSNPFTLDCTIVWPKP